MRSITARTRRLRIGAFSGSSNVLPRPSCATLMACSNASASLSRMTFGSVRGINPPFAVSARSTKPAASRPSGVSASSISSTAFAGKGPCGSRRVHRPASGLRVRPPRPALPDACVLPQAVAPPARRSIHARNTMKKMRTRYRPSRTRCDYPAGNPEVDQAGGSRRYARPAR
jgi:hypothetical protein